MTVAYVRWKNLIMASIGACVLAIGAAIAPTPVAAQTALEGTLLVRWSDPMPGKRGSAEAPEFRLATSDGRTVDLELPAAEHARALTAFG